MCDVFGDKLPTAAVMLLLYDDNASKSGMWDNEGFLHGKVRLIEWSFLLLRDLRTVSTPHSIGQLTEQLS